MSFFTFNRSSKKFNRNRRHAPAARNRKRSLTFEQLGERVVLSVTASFSPTAGTLSVVGDHADNNIIVSRDAAGRILINGGSVAIVGGTATVANTSLIRVFGQAGNDQISLDETNGCSPPRICTAAPGTIPSPAAPATTCSSATREMTSCWEKVESTSYLAAPAMIHSPAEPAMIRCLENPGMTG